MCLLEVAKAASSIYWGRGVFNPKLLLGSRCTAVCSSDCVCSPRDSCRTISGSMAK